MHRTSLHAACLILATAGITTAAAAQGRGRNATGYPPGFRPPPGMCRVWIEGVPPGHQPGVTDCVTARASAPYNSRVIYGDRNYNPSYRNPSYRRPSGVYSRTVYDGDGNRWIQRVQQNPNGLLSVLSSLPYVTGNTSTLRYSTGNTYRSKPHKGKPGKAIHGHGHGNGNGHGHGKHR
jgi:hypothetical protein